MKTLFTYRFWVMTGVVWLMLGNKGKSITTGIIKRTPIIIQELILRFFYIKKLTIKLPVLWIFLLLSTYFVKGTTYYGKNGTAPNTNTNWGTTTGGGGTNPANFTTAGDVFIIENGTTMTSTAVWTIGAGSTTASNLQINSGGTLDMNTYLLTLASCNFTYSGTFTSTTGGVTISGTLVTNSIDGFITTGTVSMTKTAGTATFTDNVNGVALTINGTGGTLNLGTSLTHTFSGDITLSAGTLNGGSSTLKTKSSTSTAWTGVGSNFTAGTGTVAFEGNGGSVNAASIFNNLTISGNSKTNEDITVNGVLTINAQFDLNNILSGSFTTIGSATIRIFYTSTINDPYPQGKTFNCKVNFIGYGDQRVPGGTYAFNGNPCLQLYNNSNAIVTGDLILTYYSLRIIGSTVVDLNGYNLTINGGGSFGATAALINIDATATFNPGTGTVFFNRTGNQILWATSSNLIFSNLTIAGSGAKTFPTGSTTVNGILSMEGTATATLSGSLSYGSSAALQYKGSGTQTTGGEFPSIFPGSGGLIIDNTNGVTFSAAKQVDYNLNLKSGTLADGGYTLSLGGNITGTGTHNGAGKITMTGSGKTISGATLQNLELNNSGGFSLSGSPTINGALTFTSGKLSIGSNTLNLPGTVVSSTAANSITGGSSSALNITGSGALGSLYFNQTTAGTTNFLQNFTINRTSTGTLTIANPLVVGNNLNLYNGAATATTPNLALNSGATITRTAGTLSAAPTFGTSANVIYGDGSYTPSITSSYELTTSSTVLNNLTVDVSGGVTLGAGANPIVNGIATFTNGKLAIGANTLTLKGSVASMTASNCLTGSGSSNLAIGGSGSLGTLYFDQSTPGTTNQIAAFTINRISTGNASLGNNLLISGAATFTAGQVAIGANTLTLNGTVASMNVSNNLIGSASSNLTIGGTGTSLGTLYFDQTTDGTTNNIATYAQSRGTTSAGTVSLGNKMVSGTAFTLTHGLFKINGQTLVLNGSFSGVGTLNDGSLSGTSASNLAIGGSGAFGTLFFDQTTDGTTNIIATYTQSRGTDKTNTVTLGNKMVSGTAFTLTHGLFKMNGQTLVLNGTFVSTPAGVSNDGTLSGTSASNLTIGGSGALGTLYFDQTTDDTTNKIATYTQSRGTNSSGTVTLGNEMVSGTAFTLTHGLFNLNGQTLVLNGTFASTPAGASNDGTLSGTTTSNLTIGGIGALGSLYFDQTSATTRTIQNLNINRTTTGTLTIANPLIVSTNLFLYNGGITATTANFTLSNTGTITRTAGTLSAAPTFGTSANIIYGDGSYATAITTSYELPTSTTVLNNLTVNVSGGVTLGTTATVNGGATLSNGKLAIGANTLTLNGTVASMSPSNSLTGSASSNLTIGGTSALGSLYFDQTSATTRTIQNLTINRTSIGILSISNPLILSTNLYLYNGTITNSTNLTLSSGATITRTAGTLSASPIFGTSANVTYGDGSYPTSITTSYELPTSTSVLNNLTLNVSGGVTLNNVDATVNSSLAFTNGKITTGSNTLSLGPSASVSGAGTSKYVYGNLQRFIPVASNPSLVFYIGDASDYAPVTINISGNVTAASGTIIANTTSGDHTQIATSGINSAKSVNRYWTLTNGTTIPGLSSFGLTFSYLSGDNDSGTTPANYVIRKYSGTAWFPTNLSGTPGNITASNTGLTTFCDFSIGEQALDHFAISSITSPKTAGTDITGITLTAQDLLDNTISSYVSNVTYSGNSGVTGSSADFTSGQLTGVSITPTVAGIGMTFIVTGSTKTGTATFDVNPGVLDHFAISSISSPQTAGTSITGITITAKDINNNTLNTGANTFTSTVQYSGTAGITGTSSAFTSGQLTGVSVTPTSAGSNKTVIVTASTKTGTATFNVNPGSQTKLVVTLPGESFTSGSGNSGTVTAQTAGTPFNVVKLSATDAYLNIVTSYSGSKTISYTGPAGSTDYTTSVNFTSGQSTTTLATTLTKAETTSITADDGKTSGPASSNLQVDAATASILAITGTSTQAAGSSQNLTITAIDPYDNTDLTYTGSKNLTFSGANTSSNPATSPIVKNSSGTAIDFGSTTTINFSDGVATVSSGNNGAMILYKTENATVHATDGTINSTGYDLSVTVSDAGLNKFVFSLTSPQTNGTAFTGTNTVTAQDAYGNTVPGFSALSNNVTVTSSPADGTITGLGSGNNAILNQAGDFSGGVATLTSKIIFTGTSGSHTFTATSATGGKTGTSGSIAINAGAASKFTITGNTTQTAGNTQNLTITAQDGSGNTADTYTGDKSVTFTGASSSINPSTAPTVTNKTGTTVAFGTATTITFSSGIATVSSGNNGRMILYRAEVADIVATQGSITTSVSDQLSVTVSAAAMNKFALALNSPQTNGTAFSGTNTLTAQDAYGNTVSYDASANNVTIAPVSPLTGSISGLSVGNKLTGAGDFSGGVASLTSSIKYTGNATTGTFTATTATGGYTGTSGNVEIYAGAATHLVITGNMSQTAGTSQNITITAKDLSDNTADTYTGSKSLTFSGANSSTNPVTAPTVKNSSGTATEFGSTTSITFSGGVANVSGSNNGIMKLYNVENETVSATDGSISSSGGDRLSVTVSEGGLNKFVFSLTSPQSSGTPFTGTNTLTAQDAWGNTITTFDASTDNVTIAANSPFTGSITGLPGTNKLTGFGDFTTGIADLTAFGIKYTGNAEEGTLTAISSTSKTGTSGNITINPAAPTGSVAQIFCSGDSPTVNVLTVNESSIKWYAAPTGGTALSSSTALTTATHYFASQTENGHESTLRFDVTVTINLSPNLAGFSTTPTNVCQEYPSVVTLSATSLPNGTYTVNYTLTRDNAQDARDISMTVTGGTNSGTFSTPDLTTAGTTSVIINSLTLNNCPTTATSGNTNDITITATGTWLGKTSTLWSEPTNWCGGVPGSLTNVVIPSAPSQKPHVDITEAASNDLTINTNAVLTIDAAKALTVSGTLTNSNGKAGLVLKSDENGTASLIHFTDNVAATVERYITGHDSAWHFLSSPVASQEISGDWLPSGTYGGTGGTGYDLYLWDEPKNCWKYKLNAKWDSLNSGVTYFNVGRGYLYSVQATHPTKSFAGNLNNDSVSCTLKYASTDAALKGFNLVGNPYPSSIDWSAGTGWSRDNLTGGSSGKDMYIFNPESQNYGVFNSGDADGTGTNGVTRYIAPMQGFFVRATDTGTLSMTNAVRTHLGANAWKGAWLNPDAISAVVQAERDQSADEVRILFGYPANDTGAAKLFSPISTAPSLYIPAGKENYTVRYLTDTITNPHVPLQFKAGSNGYYTLTFNFETGSFKNVQLEDRKTRKIQDLIMKSSYRFNASTSDAANRFVLHFVPVEPQKTDELPAKIYTDGTHILVDLTRVTGDTRALVYNVIGQKLYEQQLWGETLHTLTINPGIQLLVIRLQNAYGQLVRKIVCNSTSQ